MELWLDQEKNDNAYGHGHELHTQQANVARTPNTLNKSSGNENNHVMLFQIKIGSHFQTMPAINTMRVLQCVRSFNQLIGAIASTRFLTYYKESLALKNEAPSPKSRLTHQCNSPRSWPWILPFSAWPLTWAVTSVTHGSGHTPCKVSKCHFLNSMKITFKNKCDKEYYNFAQWKILWNLEVKSIGLSPVSNAQIDGYPQLSPRFVKPKQGTM